jgi:biofilm PGA synthesis N-glycosyltransferase PgaC
VNLGKAERLNRGFEVARHDLVVVTDADTHVHPLALKLLVARMNRSPRVAAVASAPHVTNRGNLLCAMQILEAAR